MSRSAPPQVSSTISGVTKGALYMTAAAFLFAVMNTLVRWVSAEIPPLEIAFFRNFFAFISMLPWMITKGFAGLRTSRLGLHMVRAVFGVLAMSFWFTAISIVPLANAIALNFTMPFFIVAGAAVFLGEKVGLRRWSAIGVGFVGMLVILRPGITEVSPVMALPIAAAVFMAVSALLLKHMSSTESAGTSVLYMNLLMMPLSLVPAMFVWIWPQWDVLLQLAVLGFLAMLAHLALARSYAEADISAIMPFDYARLPFIALFAFVMFGEVAEIWTWIGAAIIAASALYIAMRESFLARKGRATPTIVPGAPDL
jgi:drug/metabolite transporter (DMT)-like permease